MVHKHILRIHAPSEPMHLVDHTHKVTIGDSSLCRYVHVTSFER